MWLLNVMYNNGDIVNTQIVAPSHLDGKSDGKSEYDQLYCEFCFLKLARMTSNFAKGHSDRLWQNS